MSTEILTRLAGVKCSTVLRSIGDGASSFEQTAARIVQHLYQSLADPQTEAHHCALVRLFKTQRYGSLPPDLQLIARGVSADVQLEPDSPCLALVATAGDQPAWNSRHTSLAHRAIPIHSERLIAKSPMIGQLLHQFGLPAAALAGGDGRVLLDATQGSYGVFHVPEAPGSPYVPAQAEFVLPYGIQSVVGCGSPLTARDFFALILFSKLPVNDETARRFSTIALSAKLALLPFTDDPLFAEA